MLTSCGNSSPCQEVRQPAPPGEGNAGLQAALALQALQTVG